MIGGSGAVSTRLKFQTPFHTQSTTIVQNTKYSIGMLDYAKGRKIRAIVLSQDNTESDAKDVEISFKIDELVETELRSINMVSGLLYPVVDFVPLKGVIIPEIVVYAGGVLSSLDLANKQLWIYFKMTSAPGTDQTFDIDILQEY